MPEPVKRGYSGSFSNPAQLRTDARRLNGVVTRAEAAAKVHQYWHQGHDAP